MLQTSPVRKAGKLAKGAVCASDSFLTFSDAFQVAADAGIAAFIQPRGSKGGDAKVIEAADQGGNTDGVY
jgi:AICAR transformylase/IMP cyclohydrolase PurH